MDQELNHTMTGGYLREIPEPHVRYFSLPGARRRRVRVLVGVFSGIGRHYHVSSKVEDDYIWNEARELWQNPWDAQFLAGAIDMQRFDSAHQARAYIEDVLTPKYPADAYELVFEGEAHAWFYPEHD